MDGRRQRTLGGLDNPHVQHVLKLLYVSVLGIRASINEECVQDMNKTRNGPDFTDQMTDQMGGEKTGCVKNKPVLCWLIVIAHLFGDNLPLTVLLMTRKPGLLVVESRSLGGKGRHHLRKPYSQVCRGVTTMMHWRYLPPHFFSAPVLPCDIRG